MISHRFEKLLYRIKKFATSICLFICFSIQSNECILTIPKSGTNMVLRLLFLIDQAHGIDIDADSYISKERTLKLNWHHEWKCSLNDSISLGPTKEKVKYFQKKNDKVIIILRDPRDVCCAITRAPPFNSINSENLDKTIENPGLMLTKIGARDYFLKYHSMTDLYNDYLKWQQYDFVYTTYFELLVGPKGGGTKEQQVNEIMNISNHINKPVDLDVANEIADKLFGGTSTFKKGEIGNWRFIFSKNQKMKFHAKEKAMIIQLGYSLE